VKRILNLLFTVVVLLLSACINQQLTDKYTFSAQKVLNNKKGYITQTSHTPNGVSTLKIQYFS